MTLIFNLYNHTIMILILSTDIDSSTNQVIDWLHYYGVRYFRLNDNDILDHKIIIRFDKDNDFSFQIETSEKKIFRSEDFTVIWFRKFGFLRSIPHIGEIKSKYGHDLIEKIREEYLASLRLICYCLRNKKWLMDWKHSMPNKLTVLSMALKAGLKIPRTHVVNSKTGLLDLIREDGCITKSQRDCNNFKSRIGMFTMYTAPIPETIEGHLPNIFLPSLVQHNEQKKYELRVFYLDGRFYSMAIFSQNDPLTRADFRRYNYLLPNRGVPYRLPAEIEAKLTMLMRDLDLNTGSIDMIRNEENDYVFLEVNPCGQYEMVSNPCNYFLSRKIAEYLIDKT
jgi:ATP-GRASP peptide maturase of grasp-with-spasm system